MGKLLRFLDEKILKIGVLFAILFTAVYPKLPSVHITHTWVYIRLEDFVILSITCVWFIQLLRRKVILPFPVASPIVLYWIAGLSTLLFSLIFIGPHLANFFPTIAVLNYIRRIEYMILFFVACSTVRDEKDIIDYVKIISIALVGVVTYGFGQRWYILLWDRFPAFFEKYPFCFPSFQTGNEEFAKGIPLCLPPDARITSTFGGHYDLAAYLVLIIPILFGAFLTYKKLFARVFLLILTVCSTILLILTASRISFIAYLVGIYCMLLFFKKKLLFIPVVVVSIILLFLFSASTAQRFLETVRLASVVTTNEGKIVGVTTASLPQELQKKISKNPIIIGAPTPSQNLPEGSSFITLPTAEKVTNVAVVQAPVSQTELKQLQKQIQTQEKQKNLPSDKLKTLNLTYGGIEISTISGTFLVKRALVYDISFTTRFQSEWPNAWNAFMRNPLLGSGYATVTLATDSDYFRTLGESGLFGFISFMLVFMFLGILAYKGERDISISIGRGFIYGVSGGVIGLFLNAIFIDVFEASKVAEPLWILLGVGTGMLLIAHKEKIQFASSLKTIFTSKPFVILYLFIILGIVFFNSLSNFFVADDFTWLKWAGSSTTRDIIAYFTNASGFFYRPLDKLAIFVLFSLYAFKPEGFHLFSLLMHFIVSFGVYLLILRICRKKTLGFIGSLLFMVMPVHAENVYWISSISITLSTIFILYSILEWIRYREKGSMFAYIPSLILASLAFLSYEMAVILPFLFVVTDVFIAKTKKSKSTIFPYIPVIMLELGYFVVSKHAHALGPQGDYSYSIIHFIPNFFGNLFGYAGILLTGEFFFPIYTFLRETMRMFTASVIVLFFTLFIMLIIIALRHKNHILLSIKKHYKDTWVYGFLFALISLVPFIGLGNITERYVYLSSIGFTIIVVSCFDKIAEVVNKKKIQWTILLYVGFSTIVLLFSVYVKNESLQWQRAGKITQNMLMLLKENYTKIDAKDRMIFANVPIRMENAWIFPVGLPDALWFIYRDSTPKIYIVGSIKEAKSIAQMPASNSTPYIFSFDKKGTIVEVQ
jgi:hypothetical protein